MNDRLKKFIGAILVIASLMLVCYPRFDRQDIGGIKELAGKKHGKPSLGDAPEYVNYVKYFRGNVSLSQITLPFGYRPLGPFVASFLPIKNPMTSINVLNLVCLYVALLFLFLLLKSLGFNFWYSLAGCFMFSVSFPTFYYGTDGCIDSVLMCLLVTGTYLISKANLKVVRLSYN